MKELASHDFLTMLVATKRDTQAERFTFFSTAEASLVFDTFPFNDDGKCHRSIHNMLVFHNFIIMYRTE